MKDEGEDEEKRSETERHDFLPYPHSPTIAEHHGVITDVRFSTVFCSGRVLELTKVSSCIGSLVNLTYYLERIRRRKKAEGEKWEAVNTEVDVQNLWLLSVWIPSEITKNSYS